ncbi:hypothetical protein RND81_13G135400 [Saponaria officinalis]|uniref:Uncharacterized protein n=1 Tax=Saponaria officinalis TaxID=3572 RepID=A0AAW1H0B0_SAPOF
MKNLVVASVFVLFFLMATVIPKTSLAADGNTVVLQEASQISTDKAVRKLGVRAGPAAKMKKRKRKPWMPPALKSGDLHHQFMPPAPPAATRSLLTSSVITPEKKCRCINT